MNINYSIRNEYKYITKKIISKETNKEYLQKLVAIYQFNLGELNMSFIIIKKYLNNEGHIDCLYELQNDNGIGNKKINIIEKSDVQIIKEICNSAVCALLYKHHSNDFMRRLCNVRMNQRENLEILTEGFIYSNIDEASETVKEIEMIDAIDIQRQLMLV